MLRFIYFFFRIIISCVYLLHYLWVVFIYRIVNGLCLFIRLFSLWVVFIYRIVYGSCLFLGLFIGYPGDQRAAAAQGEHQGGVHRGPPGESGDPRGPTGPGQAGDPLHREQRYSKAPRPGII